MNECCQLCHEPIPEQASVYCALCHPLMRDAFRAVLAVYVDLILSEQAAAAA